LGRTDARVPTDWDQLVEQHSGLVWTTVRRLLDAADAADCFQDTFVAALQLAQRRRVENWPAMLRCLATARAIDRLRRRSRLAHRMNGQAAARETGPQTGPLEQLVAGELQARARALIARLPPREAEVVCLRHLSELSNEEVASVLGLRAGAVAVLLHKAHRRLQTWLDDEEPRQRGGEFRHG